MKKRLNKIIGIIAIALGILMFSNLNSYAANMKMSISKSTAYVGDTFTVTVSGINGRVNISANSNISIDKSGSQWVDGSLTITGTTKAVGTGKVTVTPVDVTTTAAEPEEVTAAASRSITIKEKEVEKPKETTTTTTKTETTTKKTENNKKTETKKEETKKEEVKEEEKIEVNFFVSTLSIKGINENEERSDIILSPEFNKDTYEYTTTVSSDIKKLEMLKDAGEFNDYLTVTGLEEDLKEGENIITIKLEKEGQETKTYTIKVTKEAKTVETIEEPAQENQEEIKEEKTTAMISMPIWLFILIQIVIIVVEVIIIKFVPWSKIFKGKSKRSK